ncbi:MAG: ABC transporter substrate-binding protein [Candidatus Rokuibacteriota bacterium]
MRVPRLLSLMAAALLLTLGAGSATAQAPIKLGDINTYSGIGAPFTGPYRVGVEMAVEEINAKGGVLGRKVEVLFRDDKAQPAEAVKHAQELIESDKVAMITGSFLSNVGLAVSDWAKQNKTMFLASESLTEALTWSKGHDHAVRLRPNTYEQGRMLADKAGKMKYVKWATIGPNYEYGKRAWETFRDRLKELKPDVQMVGEHWPTLGKIEPGPLVTAILNQNPDALYVSLFGSDWLAFVREAGKRGLFQKMFVVGILLGEPEYIDPLKLEAPEGMLVTGYPWYDVKTAGHQEWVARYIKRGDKTPVLGSIIGYITYLSVAEAIKKAGSTETPKLVAAFKGLKVETPMGPIMFRAADVQSTMGARVGTTKIDPQRGVGIMVNHEYVPGEKVLPTEEEAKKLRPAN